MKVKYSISYWSFIIIANLVFVLSNCVETPENTSPDDAKAPSEPMLQVDQSLAPTTGHFMLKSPEQMEVNQTDDIEVWITTDSIRDAAFFKENLAKNDSVVIEQIRVGEIMEVNLIEENSTDHNFNITALSSPQQMIDNVDAARWKWSVKPLKEGMHKLIVIARIKMMTEDLQFIAYKDLPVIDQTIDVKVADKPIGKSPQNNNFYWFLLAPIFGVLAWFLLRKKGVIQKSSINADEFNTFETKIQDFIKKDRIKQAFTVFETFIEKHPNEALENAVVLLKSNYTNNESRINKNLIDNDEYNLNRSKIINELLEMIDSVNT